MSARVEDSGEQLTDELARMVSSSCVAGRRSVGSADLFFS